MQRQAIRAIFLVFVLIAIPIQARSQDIVCTGSTPIASQARTSMKHRNPPTSTTQPKNATVSQVLSWAAPPDIANVKTRRSNQSIDPREDQGFTIDGDLWRVIVEDNDCDFHLELATPGQPKTASRIIVEVPQGDAFLAARKLLLEELTANGYELSVGKSITLDEPLRVTVTGFAFYDAAHYSKKNPKKGHSHGTAFVGTLWELHPVWNISFAETP
ncbi:MAG: hypothetical protein WB987_10135 [Candidatus Acidiferrales bacterium]